MAKEIERKFLVGNDAGASRRTAAPYFGRPMSSSWTTAPRASASSIVLAPADDQDWRAARSRGTNSSTRFPISDAEELMAKRHRHRSSKRRATRSPCDGFVWEVDVYDGAHRGPGDRRSRTVRRGRPAAATRWLGTEVTGDPRYSNQALATEDLREERSCAFASGLTAFHRRSSRPRGKQLQQAIATLEQRPEGLHEAIHDARTKFQAAARPLPAHRLDEPGFQKQENARLRDMGKSLSATRDATALIEACDYLQQLASGKEEAGSGRIEVP